MSQGDESDLRIAGLHELRRLRNIFSEHQTVFDLLVQAVMLQRSGGGAPVRGMLRIRDCNLLHRRIQQHVHALVLDIERRILRNPQHQLPYGITIQR